jgi:hypothetical protein
VGVLLFPQKRSRWKIKICNSILRGDFFRITEPQEWVGEPKKRNWALWFQLNAKGTKGEGGAEADNKNLKKKLKQREQALAGRFGKFSDGGICTDGYVFSIYGKRKKKGWQKTVTRTVEVYQDPKNLDDIRKYLDGDIPQGPQDGGETALKKQAVESPEFPGIMPIEKLPKALFGTDFFDGRPVATFDEGGKLAFGGFSFCAIY